MVSKTKKKQTLPEGGRKWSLLKKYQTTIPSFEEQKAIASLLEKWDTAIEKTEEPAEQYRTQKRGLMQKLLTGNWRITL